MAVFCAPSAYRWGIYGVDVQMIPEDGKKQCGLCSGSKLKPFLIDPNSHSIFSRYQLMQCQECGLLITQPRCGKSASKSAIPKLQINPFLSFQNRQTGYLEKFYSFFHPYSIKWRLRQVEKVAGVGRILDVLCGNGEFLYEMRRHLWEAVGVESDPQQSLFAQNTLGLKIVKQLPELLPAYHHYFDVITFWHNFGRFEDIHSTIKITRDLLHPQGVLMLGLPNWKSLDFRFYRQHWSALDLSSRNYHFSLRQIQLLLKKHKLELVRTKVIPFDIYYNCFFSERIAMANYGNKYRWDLLHFSRALFIALIVHILTLSGAGSGMLYFVRRKDSRAE